MTDEQSNLVLVKLEEIHKEQARTNENVGALANSLVSMRREFERAHADIQRDLASLKGRVAALGVSVDDHTHRLDKIKAHNTQLDTRLEQIEKKLDRTHAQDCDSGTFRSDGWPRGTLILDRAHFPAQPPPIMIDSAKARRATPAAERRRDGAQRNALSS